MYENKIREGAKLLNSEGERFMKRYSPNIEFTTRDVLAHGIYNEIRSGRGSEHGGVYFDLSPVPERLINEEPTLKTVKDLTGIDYHKERIEVAPTAHFFLGGIRINERCESTVRGLYAAGEAAGGIHGANRLAGNALTETQVFGALAGKHASIYASSTELPSLDQKQIDKERERVFEPLKKTRKEGVNSSELKKEIREMAWKYLAVIRDKDGLLEAIKEISRIREKASKISLSNSTKRFNREWIEALEIRDMLDLAEIIATAALQRTESRGAHSRADYPNRDDKDWLKSIVTKSENGKIIHSTEPVEILT